MKKLSRNTEIVITIILSVSLALLVHILSTLLNNDGSVDKVDLLKKCIMDTKTLWVLIDIIPPSIFIWYIIGIGASLSGADEINKSKGHYFVITAFFLYLFWYIFYEVCKDVLWVNIVNAFFLIGTLAVLLWYFKQ